MVVEMLNLKSFVPLFLGLILGSANMAQAEQSGAFYGGMGVNNDGAELQIDDTPFVLGALFFPSTQSVVFGFDIAGEGEMLDSTFGSNALKQAYSFNAVLGGNLYWSEDMRTDLSAIIGFRESVKDCPDSFIGFQCYADRDPETEYELNYGAMLTITFDHALIGLRVTEQSAQALIGISF